MKIDSGLKDRIFFIVLFSGVICAQAQPSTSSLKLSLQIFNLQKAAIPYASVSVQRLSDSTITFSGQADSTGMLSVPIEESTNYRLCISAVGYADSCRNYLYDPGAKELSSLKVDVYLNDLTDMSEVIVTGRKNSVQYHADKTILQVDASIANAGISALEVLERSPGVTVDKDGNISLKGRANVLIMIDGKTSYISGSDLVTVLSGISSSDLEQIEIIDNPSAKYDAAGNAGIINIILKKNRQRGFNANLSIAPGMGRYRKSTNSLGLNYKQGATNLFLNYGFNSNENYLDLYALRTYLNDQETKAIALLEQPTFIRMGAETHNLRAGIDFSLSKKLTVGLMLSGLNSKRSSHSQGSGLWLNDQHIRDSLIETVSSSQGLFRNGLINLNLRHKSSEKAEITADIDWVVYSINNDQLFNNQRAGPDGYTEAFKGSLPSDIRIMSAKADHRLQVNEHTAFESGLKISAISTDNIADYYVAEGNRWMPDYSRTNRFEYAEQIQSVYTSVSHRKGLWNFQAGLRFEHTSFDAMQSGNPTQKDSAFGRSYGSLFPNLLLSREVDSVNSFGFSAGRRIDRPAYQRLNPFVQIVNKYTYMAGNPLMRPQFTYNFEFSHTYRKFLHSNLSYSFSEDYFSQIFYRDSTGTIFYSEGNLGRRNIFGLSAGFSQQLNKVWHLNIQADLLHKKFTGFVWKEMQARITQLQINITNQFRFGKGWAAEVSAYYITRSQEDIQELVEPTGQVSLGLSKQLLSNKGSLKLSFRDIFYTQAMAGFTIFNQSTEYFKLQRDSRMVSLAFTWRFGKDFKSAGRRNSGASEEMERVSN